MQSDFNRVARSLIKNKIHFTTSDAEPRFEIQGRRFTTEELTRLSLRKTDLQILIFQKSQGQSGRHR
jgi:hypothetical protein